jgi:hypothetical protein
MSIDVAENQARRVAKGLSKPPPRRTRNCGLLLTSSSGCPIRCGSLYITLHLKFIPLMEAPRPDDGRSTCWLDRCRRVAPGGRDWLTTALSPARNPAAVAFPTTVKSADGGLTDLERIAFLG